MTEKIDDLDDSLLVVRISENNREAFRVLYYRYSRKIYYFSLRYLGIKEEAEELVQTIYFNIWQHRKTLNATTQIKSYLYRASLNYIANYLKKKAICARFIESELRNNDFQSENTFQEVLYRDLESSLFSIINRLPPQQQKIFQLSRYEGLSNREIAGKLDLSVRTVENHLYRVLKMLKTILQ